MNESLSPRVARSRAKILAAATDLLVESGARSVTVDAVEAASGVAKSTLYRHFSSRDDLLVAVVRSSLPDITEPDLSVGFEQALRGLVDSAARAFADPNWARIFPAVVSLRTSMPDLDEFIQADKADRQEALARGTRPRSQRRVVARTHRHPGRHEPARRSARLRGHHRSR